MEGANPGGAGLAAVLNAAAAANFALDFQAEIEVLDDKALAPDVGVEDGLFLCGFADDCAVGDAPDGGVAFPVGEGLAVKDLLEAGVVVEVERGWLVEADYRGWGRRGGCGGLLGGEKRRGEGQCQRDEGLAGSGRMHGGLRRAGLRVRAEV
jgi:hypothetical protein